MRRTITLTLMMLAGALGAFAQNDFTQTPNLGLKKPKIGSTNGGIYINQDFDTLDAAIGVFHGGFVPVPFSATPVFDLTQGNTFALTLSGNATSSTVNQPGIKSGQILYMIVCQDATGNRTFAFPTSFQGASAIVISPAASSCTATTWIWDGLISQWVNVNGLGASGTKTLIPFTTVAFTATPAFLGTSSAAYGMTLTGNVTSSTVSGSPINGVLMKLHICQGAGGPWTFAFPASFLNTTAIQSTGCTDETYSYDGVASWSQLTQPPGSGGGGSCSSSGAQGTVLATGGSPGACQTTNAVEGPSVLAINESLEVKGLNPHVDATRYGVRALASLAAIPAISGITATTTATSPSVTVSTSSCPSQTSSVCFVNGDGVVLPNAGAMQSMITPSAPTVTPFNSRWGTGTGDGIAAPAASSTYNYRLFAFDLLRGRTAVSSVGTTTTAAATLGEVTYAITGGTKSNDTITFTGATQPPVSVGALAVVDTPTQAGDNCYLGHWEVSTVTGTGFTVAGVGLDTRNPLPPGCLTTSSGGFTAHFFNYNRVTWPVVTGAYNYGVCSDRASPGTYHLLGTALYATDLVRSLNTFGTLEFDDFGSTMTDANHVAPWEFSDSDCNAVAATNDDWQTTILSGAGTTTLTMVGNAPNSNGGGQPIRFDNSPTYLTARTTVGSNIDIMLPLTTGQYVFNSPLDLRSFIEVMSAPQGFTTNAVVYFNSGALYCDRPTPGSGSGGPGGTTSLPSIITSGLPGIQIGSSTFTQRVCRITAPNNGTAVQGDLFGADNGASFWDSQFASGSTSSDYLGKGFVCHNSTATVLNCTVSFYGKTNISGGVQSMASHSATPSFICDGCGNAYFTDLTGFGRTIGIRARANTAQFAIKNMEWQGPSMPLLLLGGQQGAGNGGAAITLGSSAPVIIDTSNWPCASYIPSVGSASISFITYGGCLPVGSGTLQFTGSRMTGPGIISPNATISGQNRDVQQMLTGGADDNIFTGPVAGLGQYAAQKYDTALLTDTSYPIFVNGALPAQPTCSVSAGGSVSIANHRYQLVPVWWNGAEGITSNPSAVCTTSGGNQTVTINWTPVPGVPQGYNLYQDGIRIHNASGVGVSCLTPQITPGSTNSIVLTQDGNCGIPGPSAVPSGGPSMLMPGVQGLVAPVHIVGQYLDILGTSSVGNPSANAGRLSFNTITNELTCQTNSGANCMQVFPPAGVPLSTGSSYGPSYTAPIGNLVGTGQSNTVTTGVQDFSSVTEFRPQSGLTSALPATCTGPTPMDVYIATDAQQGRNWYFCTATNNWTQQINTGFLGLNTYGSSHTLLATESWANFTTTATATIPHANTTNKWVVFNTNASTNVTLAPDSGNITLNNVTATTATLGPGLGVEVTCNGTNCFAYGISSGGSGGSGTVGSCSVNGLAYYSAATTTNCVAASTGPDGVPKTETSTSSGGVGQPPTLSLPGIVGRAVSGIAATDTILSTDCNPNRVEYIGSVAVAVTLPTATTLGVPKCVFKLVNTTSPAQTVTIMPTTWTINGNATLPLTFGQQLWVYVDPNSATNWVADQTDLFGNINGAAVPASAKVLGTNSGSQIIAAALANTHIYVGSAGNLPVDVAASGDVSLANTGAFTNTGVNGATLPASANVVGTNSSKQIIASTAHNIVLPWECADSSGSGSAQVCNTSPTFTPAAGDTIIYTTTTANTGAALTINVNSLGAKPVAKWQTTTTLVANDIRANTQVLLSYDGTNWELTTIGNVPSGGGGGTPCTTTALSLQYNNAGAFGCLAEFTYASSTITVSSTGKLDLSSASVTAGLKLPSAAAAAPTNAGIFSYDTTANSLVWGNGTNTSKAHYFTTAPTTNVLRKASGTVGLQVDSSITDNGTTIASPEPLVLGTANCTTFGTAGAICMGEGTAPTNVASTAAIYPDSTAHELEVATNGSTSFGMLVRRQPGAIHQTAQTGAISTATLCAASAGACNIAGQYHIHFTFIETGTACAVPATGGVTFLLTWTDSNGTAHSAVSVGFDDASTINAVSQTFHFQTSLGAAWGSGDFNVSTNGTVIQYATGYTACGTGTGTYQLDASVTRLQ